MKNLWILAITCSLLLSCGPGRPGDESGGDCTPTGIRADVNRQMMTVSWKPNCGRTNSGYNIYLSKKPLAGSYQGIEVSAEVAPHNLQPFLGDTDPSDGIEHYDAEGLTDGQPYYVSVRIVFPDETLSKPSEEIIAVCGARGEIELSLRFKSDKDGFSFGHNEYVRADGVDNDLYFFSKDGKDFLASPTRLGGFLRSTKLAVLPFKGDLGGIGQVLDSSKPSKERVEVSQGDWLHIITADGGQAVLLVNGFSGKAEQRRIQLDYAFSPGPGPLVP